jgi:hemoglobin-like flavoprotein
MIASNKTRGEPRMTNQDLIEASFEIAAEQAGDLTAAVYRRLFAAHPQMEALFWRDSNGAVKGEMLSRVIQAILDFVGPRLYASTMIQCEVITHEGYEVPPEVFGVFFEVVAQTVAEVCGEAWTPGMERAWSETLAALDYYVTHPDQSQTQPRETTPAC